MVQPLNFIWAEVPFFRILIWMGVGWLMPTITLHPNGWWLTGILLLPAATLLLLMRIRGHYRYRWLTGLSTGVCLSALVWLNHCIQFSAYRARLPPEFTYDWCLLKVDGLADTSRQKVRLLCRWIVAHPADTSIPYGSILRLESDTTWRSPPPGALIVVHPAQTRRIRNLRNPHAFDSEGNAQNKGLVGRIKAGPQQISVVGRSNEFNLKHQAILLSERVCQIIYDYLPSREAALSCAILLGQRQGMDEELEQAFAGSGLIHLMAVSGMHVGIFYMMCSWLLLTVLKVPRKSATLGILLLLWAYALLTGLSPSVVRASGMFSLAAAGKLWNRQTSSYNLMSAAAFLQIWFDSRLPAQPGFLLSYAAVLGILFMHPRLFSLCYTRHKWLDKAWELTSLSLSAQWFTLPLVLYFFHSFPIYFLPANLLVVPLSGPALIGSLLLCALNFIPPLAQLFAYPLSWLLMGINQLTLWVSALPFAQSTGWYWTLGDGLLAAVFMLLVVLGWLIYHPLARKGAVAVLVIWYCLNLTNRLTQFVGGDFRIYEGYGRSPAALRLGTTAWVWSDSIDAFPNPAEHMQQEGVRHLHRIQQTGVLRVRWRNNTALWVAYPSTNVNRLPDADVLILSRKIRGQVWDGSIHRYPVWVLGSGYNLYFCHQTRLRTGRGRHNCRCVAEEGAINLWNINLSKPKPKPELAASY